MGDKMNSSFYGLEYNKVHYVSSCIDIIKRIPDNSIDLIFTDPPYEIGKESWDSEGEQDLISKWISEAHRILKPFSALFCCWSCERIPAIQPTLEKFFKLRNIIIWHYRNSFRPTAEDKLANTYEVMFYMSKGNRCKRNTFRDWSRFGDNNFDVWIIPITTSRENSKVEKIHSCQKPLPLIKKALEMQSFEGDLVLDLFAGSGSTIVAANEIGRNAIGFDNDSVMVERANNWINSHRSGITTKDKKTNQIGLFE